MEAKILTVFSSEGLLNSLYFGVHRQLKMQFQTARLSTYSLHLLAAAHPQRKYIVSSNTTWKLCHRE